MDEQNEQGPETFTERYDRVAMEAPHHYAPVDRVAQLRERAKFHREEADRCEARATDPDIGDLDARFTYHQPKGDQPHRYESIRSYARGFAEEIIAACPHSRERSLALTNIEQACFWANAGIARRS